MRRSRRARSQPFCDRTSLAACVIALGGCTTIKGWFGGDKDDDKPTEPAELIEFTPTATVVETVVGRRRQG